MENAKEILMKQVFQDMHSQIVDSVNPDSVMDKLFEEKVLGIDDYRKLRQFPDSRERCRELLSLLHSSSHPHAFEGLRRALCDEYSWIVYEIDKKLPSPIISNGRRLLRHYGHWRRQLCGALGHVPIST